MTATSWAPSRPGAVLQLLAGVVLLGLVVPSPALGRVLLVPVALAVTGLALRDLLVVPTLAVDAEGLTVAGSTSKQLHAWSDVAAVRVITDRRTPLLELDLDHTVVVLSRRRLGAAPYLVLEDLEALRPR